MPKERSWYMLTQVVHYFYPDLKKEEIKKYGLLSFAFFLTIGAYWTLRLLKDTVFFKLAFPVELGWAVGQGRLFQPLAKTISVFVVIALVAVYTKLVDMFEKHKLFYIVCGFYAIIFSAVTGALFVQSVWGSVYLGKTVLGAIGWITYLAIESFGSILVALFWSFTASVVTTDSAKRGYPLIIAAAQVGAIGGSALNLFSEQIGGIWQLFLLSTLFVLAIMFVIKAFMTIIPVQDRIGNREAHATEKKHEGFIEGLVAGVKLLFTRGYLFGILIVSTFYEVINTIIDYQMKSQADLHPSYQSATAFNKFMGVYGLATNTLAFLMVLLGTSYIMKRYGLTFCLLFYPVILTGALSALYGFFLTSPSATYLLWATFGVMMVAKGLSYAVNNPTKEMMYIPTSKDAKFKTKGFIDMFGSRMAKMGGARVSDPFKHHLADLMTYGTLLSFGLIGIWLAAALYVGRKNAHLTKEGHIVE